MTQIELEQEMVDGGRERARKMFENNAEAGNAAANPYASAIFRRFVLPLAAMIREDMEAKAVGRRMAHVQLIEGMDYDAVAFIAVRNVLNTCMNGSDRGGRGVVQEVGKAVHSEYCLTVFSTAEPALYYTLVNDFDRKMTKSERHRMTVFKMQAKQAGIAFTEWGIGGQAQVGSYLVECLQALGMCDVENVRQVRGGQLRNVIDVTLTVEVKALLSKIQEHVMEATPAVMPCVEVPKDWTAIDKGGWHTEGMQRASPYCVKARPVQREHFRKNDMSTEFKAINILQRVKWKINSRMLDTIRRVAAHFDMDEIVSQADFPAPKKPAWLEQGVEKAQMTANQLGEFTNWKRATAEWHTQMKLRGTKWGRFYTATRIAEKFRNEERLYFVYFSDFRGRKYAQTTGVSPQGSDMQKALLQFAEGKKLVTPDQKEWFLINGANRFGVDKVSIGDRIEWVREHHEQILAFARDPIENNEWREADSPFQFLAWCFEYADWHVFGANFRSHLAVGMDGSCNGLQNFSAMLRDEVGGAATNLTPGDVPNDIYAMVARIVQAELQEAVDDEAGYRKMWVAHGVNRSLVKRSVMTLPYGSTRFSCSDFIVGDYLRMGKAPEFAKEDYSRAATYLSHFVWRAIGQVVIKARAAMDWLQASAQQLVRSGITEISWVTPSGFPAIQTYWEAEVRRINTRLCGGTKLSINAETDVADRNRHRNGIAPNFIHSMDASHLTLTVLAAATSGIDALAMIHDDYGTHAADAPALAKAIREVFVEMYRDSSPLEDLRKRYPKLPKPPAIGTLDLEAVLASRYFFC
jgi:DNA-directed RNA polymerase